MTNSPQLTSLPDNALDYLLSAGEYLEQRNERSLKYSILHLFAGIELLLKERLRREHWSLIFQDLSQANAAKLASGDFKSVDFHTCTSRLTEIASISVTKPQLKHLESLRQLRNRIQHFHPSMSESDATSRLANGTNFAVHFITSEMPDLNQTHKVQLSRIHIALAGFNEFVACRMANINDDLKPFVNTVMCPHCEQETLGLGNGDPRCPFCGFTDKPFEALHAAGDDVTGWCPDCGPLMGVYDCTDGGEVAICFSCGTSR